MPSAMRLTTRQLDMSRLSAERVLASRIRIKNSHKDFSDCAALTDVLSDQDGAAFSLLSGIGADQTERRRVPFARYKGEAEKILRSACYGKIAHRLLRPDHARGRQESAVTISTTSSSLFLIASILSLSSLSAGGR